jgi:ABC-type Fe3+-siderophore transport system permease subunit
MKTAGNKTIMGHFIQGGVLFLTVQAIFMGGGLLVETLARAPISGVPSMAGLTVVLFLAAMRIEKKSEYVLLGSFSIAFLAPLALFLVTRYKVFPVEEPTVYFSMGYLSALIVAVWLYFAVKIIKGKMCPRVGRLMNAVGCRRNKQWRSILQGRLQKTRPH